MAPREKTPEPFFELFSDTLPLLPQPKMVLLPHVELSLHVYEQRHIRLVEDAKQSNELVGLVRYKPGWQKDYLGDPPLRRIGCAGRILTLTKLDEGGLTLEVHGLRKFEIIKEKRKKPYRTAEIRWLGDANADARDERATELAHRIMDILDRAHRARGGIPVVRQFPPDINFSGVVNRLAIEAGLDEDELSKMLELHDVYAHARIVERVLKSRLEVRRQAERMKDDR